MFSKVTRQTFVSLGLVVLVACGSDEGEKANPKPGADGTSTSELAREGVNDTSRVSAAGEQAVGEPKQEPVPPREPDPSELAAEPAGLPAIAALPDPRGIGDSPRGLKNGDFAPELFHTNLMDGKRFRLSDWVGPEATEDVGAVIVGFTASWCGPCKQSYPYLQQLQKKHGGQVKVVLLTTDPLVANKEKHRDLVRSAGLEAPLLDPSPDTLRAWMGRKRNVPHFYIINKAGEVLVQDRGFGKKVKKVMPGQVAYALRHPEYVVRR